MSRSSFLLPTLAVLAVLAGPAPGRAAQRHHEPPAKPQKGAADGLEPLAPGEMRVKAESYEQPAKGHMEARGTVDLRLAGMRIEADKADVYDEAQPDGSVKRRLVAEGNVVFIRGEERLAGDRLEMDDTGRGFLENAIGYVEPGVFVEGRRVERVDDKTYKVEGGKFTSCEQPNPRWKFSARRARIEVNDKITATLAVFRVKGVPVLLFPYIYYPLEKSGRSTGFLSPHLGHSPIRGYGFGTGFFWAMGRSADQTFSFDDWSKTGLSFGHELRYTAASPSRGTFRTSVFQVKAARTADYDVDWNALQMLPGQTHVALNVRKYSNLLFQQRFQDDFNNVTTRTQRWSATLDHDFKLVTLNAYADEEDTYFGARTQVRGHLPGISLRRFPRQIGWGGIIFGLQATADRIRWGSDLPAQPLSDPVQYVRHVDTLSRYDVAPKLSRPFRLSFLEFNPSFAYRYTRYGASNVDEDGTTIIAGPPLDRSFFDAGIELRGPTFSRVFDTPGFFYSERFKHTIGPELSWRYVTRVENFTAIPKVSDDAALGTDELQYALVQRFYAKRHGPTGKPQAYEFFSWRLMQTYYVQIAQGQNNFDPNYASSAFGPGGKPQHLSPLSSRMRFRPSPAYALDYTLEYDVNYQQLTRMLASANVSTARATLSASWSRRTTLSENPAERKAGQHTLRGNTTLEVWPKRLFVEGSVDYDLVHDILYNMRGRVRYVAQCCGFSVEHIRYSWNSVTDARWHFNVELANIGSMGNFLGADAAASRQGLGGYR